MSAAQKPVTVERFVAALERATPFDLQVRPWRAVMTPSMIRVREALEESWSPATAYRGASRLGVPSFGQCYPTSRVLQLLYPAMEIVEGRVWTGIAEEKHFWNLLETAVGQVHVDLTWQQFPQGAIVRDWYVRDRSTLNDSEATQQRVEVLLQGVRRHLNQLKQ